MIVKSGGEDTVEWILNMYEYMVVWKTVHILNDGGAGSDYSTL